MTIGKKIVTRIAPSPTGQMHVGTVRSALFNYLFAKQNGGDFLVRIEDTDTSRNRPEWTDMIWKDLEWIGIVPDRRYIQSEHATRHQELLQKLVDEQKAYLSKEAAKDGSGEEVEVVRLKNPGKSVTFTDLLRGEIAVDTTDLGDFVIARSLTQPLYHFAVVVDDADAEVSHVIRGEDILPSTARQILIQEALGFPRPAYLHLPLILSTDRKKLSKRKHVVALEAYRNEGYLPQAILNYLALVGWNPGTPEEYFTLEELIQRFSLDGIQKSGAIFDVVKLRSVNQYWMRKLSDEDFITHLAVQPPSTDSQNSLGGPTAKYDGEKLKKAVPLLKDRAQTFGEAKQMLAGELSCLFVAPSPDWETLLKKELPERPGIAKTALETLSEAVKALPEGLSPDAVKEALMPVAEAEEARGKGGRGAVLWPLRYALSGQEKSPDPFTLISILGPAESTARIQTALSLI